MIVSLDENSDYIMQFGTASEINNGFFDIAVWFKLTGNGICTLLGRHRVNDWQQPCTRIIKKNCLYSLSTKTVSKFTTNIIWKSSKIKDIDNPLCW